MLTLLTLKTIYLRPKGTTQAQYAWVQSPSEKALTEHSLCVQ
jgi:hypothetical protein